jgi:hypothetical protein
MANHCYNHIIISGWKDEAELKAFTDWLDSYKSFEFFTLWGLNLLEGSTKKKLSQDEKKYGVNTAYSDWSYQFGTIWFGFNYEVDEDTVTLSGDSAWSPPVELFENYSLKCPHLDIHMFYEECGLEIGGDIDIKEGNITGFQGSYLANLFFVEEYERIEFVLHAEEETLEKLVRAMKEIGNENEEYIRSFIFEKTIQECGLNPHVEDKKQLIELLFNNQLELVIELVRGKQKTL